MEFKLHYWPPLVSAWFVLSLLTSYITALLAENVYPILPYISELGIWKPSSCIFSQMLNIGALLTGVLLYLRYRQIDFIIKSRITKLRRRWNELEFYLGIILSVGLCIVGNFPGEINGYKGILVMHMIGAFMTFGIGGIYLAIQTKMTFALQPYYDRYPETAVSKPVQYFRLLLTICFGISFVIVLVAAAAWTRARKESGDYSQWCSPDTPGYNYHLISAIFEWVLAIVFFTYTVTATNEFKAISFKEISFESVITENKKNN